MMNGYVGIRLGRGRVKEVSVFGRDWARERGNCGWVVMSERVVLIRGWSELCFRGDWVEDECVFMRTRNDDERTMATPSGQHVRAQ